MQGGPSGASPTRLRVILVGLGRSNVVLAEAAGRRWRALGARLTPRRSRPTPHGPTVTRAHR